MMVKSEDRLHFEVTVAAIRLAEAVDLHNPKITRVPDWLREPLETYRAARFKIANPGSLESAIRKEAGYGQ